MNGEDPRSEAGQLQSGLESMQMLNGMLLAFSKTASPLLTVASANMASMLANPSYEPPTETGESRPEACARRACDYAEALLAEVHRRERQQQEAQQ